MNEFYFTYKHKFNCECCSANKYQISFLSEFIFTNVTIERRVFSRVKFEMDIQTVFLGEFLFAKDTLERFFSSVNCKMFLQIAFTVESLFTKVTLKRLFPGVNLEMDFQAREAYFGKDSYCITLSAGLLHIYI